MMVETYGKFNALHEKSEKSDTWSINSLKQYTC